MAEQRDLQKQGQDIQLQLKEMDHKVNKFHKDSKDAATKVGYSLDRISSSRLLKCGFNWRKWHKNSRHGQEKIETCSSTRKKSVHVAKETQKLSEKLKQSDLH